MTKLNWRREFFLPAQVYTLTLLFSKNKGNLRSLFKKLRHIYLSTFFLDIISFNILMTTKCSLYIYVLTQIIYINLCIVLLFCIQRINTLSYLGNRIGQKNKLLFVHECLWAPKLYCTHHVKKKKKT